MKYVVILIASFILFSCNKEDKVIDKKVSTDSTSKEMLKSKPDILSNWDEVDNIDSYKGSIEQWESLVTNLLDNQGRAYKSDKKDGLVERLDAFVEQLKTRLDESIASKTKLVQRNKQTGEIRNFTTEGDTDCEDRA